MSAFETTRHDISTTQNQRPPVPLRAASQGRYEAVPLLLPVEGSPPTCPSKGAASAGITACSNSACTGFARKPVRWRVQMRTQRRTHAYSSASLALVDVYSERSVYSRSCSEARHTRQILSTTPLWIKYVVTALTKPARQYS